MMHQNCTAMHNFLYHGIIDAALTRPYPPCRKKNGNSGSMKVFLKLKDGHIRFKRS